MRNYLLQTNLHIFLTAIFCLLLIQSYGQNLRCNASDIENILLQKGDFNEKAAQIELFTQEWIENQELISNRENYKLKLVVHIVYRSEEGNITDEQVISQIEVLNKDFQALNEDYNNDSFYYFNQGKAQIEFSLATEDPSGNPTDGITRHFTPEMNIGEKKDANGRSFIKHNDLGGVDAWPSDSYINIWIGERLASYGEGTRPGLSLEGEDGIVVDPRYFGTTGIASENAPFHLGRVCTHEMGHFLNLLHIWGQDQSCTSDDLVKDTPPQQFPYFGCAEASFQCGEREMIHNYMDYVDDTCMFYFSKGQVNRMWACIEGPRKSLIENQNEPPSMLFPAENPFLIKYISGLQEIHIYFADDFVLTELLVYSLDGKRLLNLKGPVQDYLKIDAQQWETGPYIVCLQSNEKKWTEKLIKIY